MKPFVKWVGGKRSILNLITSTFPKLDKISTYIEPMVGGGIVTCWVLKYTKIENIIINDSNETLMKTYELIKENPETLIESLKELEYKYNSCSNDLERKDLYYKVRDEFNNDINKEINLIFLNKTCFNGLFRLNKKGEFNSPMGYYLNPKICDEENILELHEYFKRLTILTGDYNNIIEYADEKSLIYFDPPYRPLNKTSNFVNYNDTGFDDENQKELKLFIDKLNDKKSKIILSNSDPKNTNPEDNFFDDLYNGYNIKRIEVPRFINCVGGKRGKIKELLITNY